MTIFYFTATGNDFYIAKELGGKLYSIPKVLKSDKLEFEDDAIGIVYPCYYLGTPKIVVDFLKTIKLKSDYIFTIMSNGGTPGDGTGHFCRVAVKYGIKVSYSNVLLMPDNYLPLDDMQEVIAGIPGMKISENLGAIIADIKARKVELRKAKLLERLATIGAQFYFKLTFSKLDKSFSVDSACNGCRVCAKVCPVNNIKVDKTPQFLHHCQGCMACVHACPQTAIHMAKEKSPARYINPNVTLNEIIEANDAVKVK
jgi:ferredoxin